MSGPTRILCVDDDPDIRTIAVMALGLDPAIDVRAAASGAAALSLLDRGDWRPDAMLLDVMMPDMDGPALLAAVRDRAPLAAIPVIFMTARARRVDVDAYAALGASGVIVKPFDPLALAGELRGLIASA